MVTHEDILKRIARALRADSEIVRVKRGSHDEQIVAECEDGSVIYVGVHLDTPKTFEWACGQGG